MTSVNTPSFSVIICSVNPWYFAQAGTCFERLLRGFPFEIIGIHDTKSLAEGYNRGLRRARGDIVIFSHDDVTFLDKQFAQKIAERIESWDILGFAGASRLVCPTWFGAADSLYGAAGHWSRRDANVLDLTIYGAGDWPVTGGIAALDGLCIIARHEVAEAIGFDSDTFDGWHLYDCDFSFAAYLAGYKIGVCCDIPYIHASASVQSEESAFLSDSYQKYVERFLGKHGDKHGIEPLNYTSARCVGCYANDHKAMINLWTEDVFRRAALTIARRHKEAA